MKASLQVILSLVACLLSTTAQAQDYQPMPTGQARWDVARCWYFYPAGWYDRYYIETDGTDTVINSHTYKKLYHTTHHAPGTEFDSTYTHFLGGYREADKRVYMISEYLCLDTIERVIYDFNATSVGDTIFTQVLTNGLTQFIPHIVTAITATEVDGETHRQLELRDENSFFTEIWTEGVGSSMGFVYATYWLLTDNSYDLNCFYTENELNYTNPMPAYAFCTPPLPPSDCTPTTSTDPDITADDVLILPNPASLRLRIDTKANFNQLTMFNTIGIEVLRRNFTHELDIAHLAPGVYWISLESGQQTNPVVKKVVIQ